MMISMTMRKQKITIMKMVCGKKGGKIMCNKKNDDLLFNFDGDEDTELFKTAMDISAMKLTPEELEDHLSAYGLTRDDLELIGADPDFDESNDDWDD